MLAFYCFSPGAFGRAVREFLISLLISLLEQSGSATGVVEQVIRTKLTASFQPSYLAVVNESFKHSVPPGSETHFSVTIVSDAFEGQPLIARHRAVNETLKEELASGVHALSILAKTPTQWEASAKKDNSTPNCLGGSKADRL